MVVMMILMVVNNINHTHIGIIIKTLTRVKKKEVLIGDNKIITHILHRIRMLPIWINKKTYNDLKLILINNLTVNKSISKRTYFKVTKIAISKISLIIFQIKVLINYLTVNKLISKNKKTLIFNKTAILPN
jgi:hypothetical protein